MNESGPGDDPWPATVDVGLAGHSTIIHAPVGHSDVRGEYRDIVAIRLEAGQASAASSCRKGMVWINRRCHGRKRRRGWMRTFRQGKRLVEYRIDGDDELVQCRVSIRGTEEHVVMSEVAK